MAWGASLDTQVETDPCYGHARRPHRSTWATGAEPCDGTDVLHAGLHEFLWEGFIALRVVINVSVCVCVCPMSGFSLYPFLFVVPCDQKHSEVLSKGCLILYFPTSGTLRQSKPVLRVT